MNLLDSKIKDDCITFTTVDSALKHTEFVDMINYLISEGFIEIEESEDGEVRAYPTSR